VNNVEDRDLKKILAREETSRIKRDRAQGEF
jgi:hypothetical protein